MVRVGFATNLELKQAQRLRKRVFCDELGIQEESYQDVFHDFFSKNIVISRDAEIAGAVRLAFSRELQKYYISYLVLSRCHRKHSLGSLLIGGILQLMHINRISVVYADAYDQVVDLYQKFGCQIIGSSYFKYGFNCPWVPMRFTRESNPSLERWLVSRVARALDTSQCKWEFFPDILLCEDLAEYGNCVTTLIRLKLLGRYLPHLHGRKSEDIIRSGHEDLKVGRVFLWRDHRRELRPGHHEGAMTKGFEYYNDRFLENNVIVTKAGATVEPFSICYSMLSGKSLVTVDDWSQIREKSEITSALYFLDPSECTIDAVDEIRNCSPCSRWGIMTGGTVEALSSMVIKNYLYFTNPLKLHDPRLSSRIRVIGSIPVSKRRSACLDLRSLNGCASHMILNTENHGTVENQETLVRSHLLDGFSYGRTLRCVNDAFSNGRQCRSSILLGDPCLRVIARKEPVQKRCVFQN